MYKIYICVKDTMLPPKIGLCTEYSVKSVKFVRACLSYDRAGLQLTLQSSVLPMYVCGWGILQEPNDP